MSYINTIYIDTTGYIFAHGHAPRGKGVWAFYMGNRNDINKLYCTPGSRTFGEARRLAQNEARKQGADYVSVGA